MFKEKNRAVFQIPYNALHLSRNRRGHLGGSLSSALLCSAASQYSSITKDRQQTEQRTLADHGESRTRKNTYDMGYNSVR